MLPVHQKVVVSLVLLNVTILVVLVMKLTVSTIRLRAPGSIGGASDPARVFKGMRMAGQYGNTRVKVKNLSVAKILAESN